MAGVKQHLFFHDILWIMLMFYLAVLWVKMSNSYWSSSAVYLKAEATLVYTWKLSIVYVLIRS